MNVYAVPLVSPDTWIAGPVPVPVAPPGEAVTTYPVTGEGGESEGVKDTVARPSPGNASTLDAGGWAGVTLFEGVDTGPSPAALSARTVNV